MPGEDVVLSCELSRADAPVRWLKDGKAIRKGQKYNLLFEDAKAMLVVRGASLRDSGEYTCETGAARSTARLCVEGECLGPVPGPLAAQDGASAGECALATFSALLFGFPLQKRQTGSQRSWLTCRLRSGAQLCLPARQNSRWPL